uniref:Uncharacterized protein n=1 Tax=Ciona savignyi TaxID=51511 RepID=H2Z7U8_CIOSA
MKEDVKIDKVEDEKEVLSAPKMEEEIPKSESPEPVMESEDNSLVYVIDKEEDLPQDHPRFRGPRHPRGGRPIRPRERMQEKEEARIQRIYEEEKEKMEWEEELHHQLQMERWEEERRRAGPGPFRRGRGRGGFPRASHRDGWDSPPVDDDVDIARGSIRRGPPRPPVGRAPRFPPREREGRHRPPPMMHDDMHGRPPPGFHRGRSPPEHRLPPHPRHPGEPRLPDWDRGHRLPPGMVTSRQNARSTQMNVGFHHHWSIDQYLSSIRRFHPPITSLLSITRDLSITCHLSITRDLSIKWRPSITRDLSIKCCLSITQDQSITLHNMEITLHKLSITLRLSIIHLQSIK